MANPWDNDPIIGSGGPVYGAPPKIDPYAAEDQQLQREANARAAEANARAAEANNRSAQEFAATHNPDGSPKPPPRQLQNLPAAAATGIQENLTTIQKIDQAIAALKARPQSIGPGTGVLGETFTQLNDPSGNDARQRIGEIGAYKIHDLSGAAVSASEAPRFSAFVPKVTDTPDKVLTNLQNFRNSLAQTTKGMLDFYGPNNGFIQYQTPQSQQFIQELAPAGSSGDAPGMPKRFTPEQQDQFFAILQNSGVDAADEYMRQTIGQSIRDKAAAAKPHSNAIDYSAADAAAKAQIAADAAKRGNTGVDAFGQGVAQGVTLGASDEIQSFGTALRGSLSGQGSFGDLYNSAQDANQAYQSYLGDTHPVFYGAGNLVGGAVSGLAAPVGTGPAGLLKSGAALGGLYGFNSGQGGVEGRISGGALGAVAGAALPEFLGAGFAGRGLAARNAMSSAGRETAIPPLVDAITGRINEPLEAMRPGQRVAAAQDFGIQLPMGAATDRGGAIIEKGLDNLPGSAGVMNDNRRAVEGQVQNAVENVATKFGSARTLNEGGAEVQSGTKEWMTRFDATTSKAYNAIPISPKAPTNLSNTKATLEQLAGKLESNPELQAEIRDPTLLRYLDAINKNGLDWQGIKDFRTFIGNKIGQFRFSEDARTGDYRALYAALSEDMRTSAAAQGPGALRAFERANAIKAEGERRIEESLSRILGPDAKANPEKAAAAIQAMTKGGKSTGDLKTLAAIRASTVKSGAWDEIAGTLIRMGGQPANSPGRAFDPKVFVQWYSDMAEPARAMLFKPELRKTLDQFVAVNQRLAGSNALRNTSQTIPNMTGTAFAGGAGAALMLGHLGTLAAIGGEAVANYGMAKVWTNPRFVQWATGYSRAIASGNENAVKSQIGRLAKLAATNPELREPLQKLLNHANDNAIPALAASNTNTQDQ